MEKSAEEISKTIPEKWNINYFESPSKQVNETISNGLDKSCKRKKVVVQKAPDKWRTKAVIEQTKLQKTQSQMETQQNPGKK